MSKRKTLSDVLPDMDAASRLEASEATIRDLRRELKATRKAHGDSLEFNDAIIASISRMQAPAIHKTPKAPKHGAEVALVTNFNDWHIGEKINEEEMDGFNKYDQDIAEARLALYLEKVREWVAIQRKGYIIRRCYVNVLGDLINGDLHPESYWRTESFPVPQQITTAGTMLGGAIGNLAADFESVEVNMIGADNHARRTKKPATKTAAMNSYNYPIYEIARVMLERVKNVKLIYHKQLTAQPTIEGRSVLLSHGHEHKAWMGIPFYGIERSEGREARKRLKAGRPHTAHIMGHWHVGANMPGLVISGALCGSTEYDAMAGRHADASQSTYLVHREHGEFSFIHWNLQGVKP